MNDAPALDSLIAVIRRLRDPQGGCPWDLEQTAESYVGYLEEESREVAEAVREGDPAHVAEELGDVLFNVLFLATLYQERGAFTIEDVITANARKMITRHPHVFGDERAAGAEDAIRIWNDAKRKR